MYTEEDAERLRRILELRDVMGLDLERIRAILGSEDRLAELRAEVARGTSPARHREILAEAIELNARMQEEVNEKLGQLQGFLAELKAKQHRYKDIVREHERESAH